MASSTQWQRPPKRNLPSSSVGLNVGLRKTTKVGTDSSQNGTDNRIANHLWRLAHSTRFRGVGNMNRTPPWGLNFDSPPAQPREHRLFRRIPRYGRQIPAVSKVLLQFARSQITGFSQDFLVLLLQLLPKEFHFSGTRR